jgi:DNA invertase Pin-like site-specific DNA recombinase
MTILGYTRVSTRNQSFAGQIELLSKTGAKPIFREKIGGAKVNRPELSKLMKAIRPVDVALVTGSAARPASCSI